MIQSILLISSLTVFVAGVPAMMLWYVTMRLGRKTNDD